MTLLARAVRGRAGPRGVGTGICAAPWGNRPEPSIPIGLRGPPTCRHRVWRMGWEPSGRASEDHTRGMGSRGDRGQGSWATCCCSGLPRERPSPSPTPASLVSVADLCPRLVSHQSCPEAPWRESGRSAPRRRETGATATRRFDCGSELASVSRWPLAPSLRRAQLSGGRGAGRGEVGMSQQRPRSFGFCRTKARRPDRARTKAGAALVPSRDHGEDFTKR